MEGPREPFRERLRARPEKHAPADAPWQAVPPPAEPVFLPLPDGSFRVLAQASPSHGPRPQGRPPGLLPATVDSLQFGRGARELRLHVRLGEGPNAGVEVRGIWEDGRVRVELLAPPEGPPPDLDAVRAALRARGLEGVSVDLGGGSREQRRPPPQPPVPTGPGASRIPVARAPQAPPEEPEW
ncbi:MAG: hypothetical protein HY909_26925 [Deltaproteobacteria bacterium]|nr:hypothetical protein [Deltaproteobacteria bacterium]